MPLFSNHSIRGWNLFGFILIFFIIALSTTVNASEPFTPKKDEQLLETLPTNQHSKELKQLKQQLTKKPKHVDIATQLATKYINIARRNSDARYYGYAQATLKTWWMKHKPPQPVLFLRAILHQHNHQYDQAISDLQQLLKQQPRHTQAWLTLSIIQQVQGNYSSAKAACSALARTSSSLAAWLSSFCYSQVWSLTGDAKRALKLQKILALQVTTNPKLHKWVLEASAETSMHLGNNQQADKLFIKALSIPERDSFLLRVYSDFLITQKRPEAVLALLKEETQDDALLLRLAIAAKNAKQDLLTKKYRELLESRYKAANLRGSKLHQKDEALYLLEFSAMSKKQQTSALLKRALEISKANWQTQKEPDDALVLLRAAIATKSNEEIKRIDDWVVKSCTPIFGQLAKNYFHTLSRLF